MIIPMPIELVFTGVFHEIFKSHTNTGFSHAAH
jgi:hypothetical protein